MLLAEDLPLGATRNSLGRKCLWLGSTLLVAFLLSRAWMFLPQVPRFYGISHDAAWFWDLQAQIDRGPDAPASDFQRARLAARSSTDMALSRGVVALSRGTGCDRWTLNLVVTTALFLLAVGTTFAVVVELLGSLVWAMPLTLLISQSRAFSWLDYQVLAPKMVGFAIFPLLLLALIRYARGAAGGHRIALGVLMLMAVLYGPTALYLIPVTMPILVWLAWCASPSQARWRTLVEVGIGGIACLVLIRVASGGAAGAHPPPLAIAEYFYSNQYLSRSWGQYRHAFLDIVLLTVAAIGLLAALKRRGEEPMTGGVLLAAGGGCLVLGLIAHAVAARIDLARMLWLWRIAYYAHLPLLLFVILVGAMAVRRQADRVMRWGGIGLLAGCAASVLILGSKEEQSWRPALKTVHAALSGTIEDRYGDEIATLVGYAKQTPADSVFLMPPARMQSVELGHLFEAESGRCAALSIAEKYLMIVEMPITRSYRDELLALDAAYLIPPDQGRIGRLREVAARVGATHIIVPVEETGRFDVEPEWTDGRWAVFAAAGLRVQVGLLTSN